MTRITTRRAAVGIAAAALLCTLPSAASAATISYSGDTLVFTAAPGEVNDVALLPSEEAGKVVIGDTDAGITVPADRCTAYSDWNYLCDTPAQVRVDLGDGADRSDVELGFPVPAEFLGGAGGDTLYASRAGHRNTNPVTLDGGDGNDEVIGAEGPDVLNGGAGNDRIRGGGDADVIQGGDGDDVLRPDVGCDGCGGTDNPGADTVDGGAGVDQIDDWAGRGPVSLSIDGQANDGPAGEGDNVTGVEDVYANVSGTYTMSNADDKVYVSSSAEQGANVVNGLGGNDRLEGENQRETLDGGAGDDYLEGGFGDDTIIGGAGRDTIVGDNADAQCGGYGQSCTLPFGNDTIHARDGVAESIDCGVGTDTAYVDATDTVANCETVDKSGAATPTAPGGGSTTPNTTRPCVVPRIKAGSALGAARKRMAKAGCAVMVKRVKHRKVRKGRVIRTSVKAGRSPKAGAKVVLYVSRGNR